MSFFNNLGLQEPIVNDETANGTSFTLVNGGTQANSLILECKWHTPQPQGGRPPEPPFIETTFSLMDSSFKDSRVRLKSYLMSPDLSKRQKHANLLSRLYMMCGVQPKDAMPTDQDLAEFVNKTSCVDISLWGFVPDNGTEFIQGNSVIGLLNPQGFVPVDGTRLPKTDAEVAEIEKQAQLVRATSGGIAPAPMQQAPMQQAPMQQQQVQQQAPQPQDQQQNNSGTW